MLKSGGAAIPMRDLDMTYLAGGPITEIKPLPVFDDCVCDFLNDLSKEIKADRRLRSYPDVTSFAFYCRKSNIWRLREQYRDGSVRLGRGLAFHIAPSNVPVNFAFTYLFGLISGNANVVRVSAKPFEQVSIICDAMNRLFEREEYKTIREQTAIVRYERNKEITDALSALADVRIIWGGDATIAEIRKSPLGSRAKEITFADRYSFAFISAKTVLEASDEEIIRAAGQFYNDTYLMDQNACSTPHLLCWMGESEESLKSAKDRFWRAVCHAAEKYDLADIKVSDKYVLLCKYAMELSDIQIERFGNLLYVISLQNLPERITDLRGRFGLFFQCDVSEPEEMAPYVDKTVQSCMYYGVDRDEIVNMIAKNHLTGIDRVVEFGKSLDIGVIWDGYDLPRELSRVIGVM